jgi:biofilm PGA synthesis protein PgaA
VPEVNKRILDKIFTFGNMRRYLVIFFALIIATDAMSLTTGTATAKGNKTGSYRSEQIAGRVLSLTNQGHLLEAEELVNQFPQRPYQQSALPLLRAWARFYNDRKDYVDEAATYQHILQLLPYDREALRGRAFAAFNMGALHLATKFAEQHPDMFSQDELLAFHQASAGRSVKWGTVEGKAGLGRQRFQATDKALLRNETVVNRHNNEHKRDTLSGRFSQFDRIVALRDRVRMDEVISLYKLLKQQRLAIPAYALSAVADAYLHNRQPEMARDLYLQALASSKKDRDYPNREWQLKLFDAYLDTNEFDAARELIDELVNTIPPILNKGLRGVEVDNEVYEQARVNQARARLFADELNDGQGLLEKTLEAAPFNLDARLAKGDLLQFRDQPRAAQRQYASILADDPGNSSAAAGIAETAITINDYQTAKQQLDALNWNYPEDREVQRLQRFLHNYRQPLATVTSGWGSSPTGLGNRGSENWQVDTMLHSSLFKQNWRGFVHAFNAEANFVETAGIRRRIGVGLDYRSPVWRFSGEVNQDQTKLDHYGVTLDTAWMPDDHWQLDFKFESNSNNIPLQASAANIRMRSAAFGINYNHNESRNLSANFGYSWLSDGNRRIEAGASWQERWWSGPVYKLDTILSMSGSDNSLTDAAYFNPRRDFSIVIQVINEWLLWRNYERNFKHRVVLAAGEYWQQGFASGMTSTIRYEQELNLDAYRSLNYGIAYERHPYDGQHNESTTAFLNLTWHL